MTLEEWIKLIESVINEKEILMEHTTSTWEKKFHLEQLKIYNDELSMLKELQYYRNENKAQTEIMNNLFDGGNTNEEMD